MREVGFLLFSSLKAKIAWRKIGLFTISAETTHVGKCKLLFSESTDSRIFVWIHFRFLYRMFVVICELCNLSIIFVLISPALEWFYIKICCTAIFAFVYKFTYVWFISDLIRQRPCCESQFLLLVFNLSEVRTLFSESRNYFILLNQNLIPRETV